ncbi:MAG TPA: SCO family protein [Povalibacter sp.]|jgi:protein SCO1/2|nr:SCO family protein [Povalibacter sp.]
MKFPFFVLLLACAMAQAADRYPPQSIYNLEATLTDQDGVDRALDSEHGHPVLITMFYGSCPMACPMLIDTLRLTDQAAQSEARGRLRVVMISIDPDRDTVPALQALAQARHIDTSRWTLLRTDATSVRRIAAMLNVQYRQLPDGSFSHSSVISLLNPEGEIVIQSSVLARADPALVDALNALPAPALARQPHR